MGTCCGLLYGRGLGFSPEREGPTSFLRLHFQGAPQCTDLQSRLFANRQVSKMRNLSSDSRSLLLGSNPFRRPLAVMGNRHLPPVSAWPSASVFMMRLASPLSKPGCFAVLEFQRDSFSGTRQMLTPEREREMLLAKQNLSTPQAMLPFHSRLPATPQSPTHSDRFKLYRKPFPSSVHKVCFVIRLLVYLLLKPRSALEMDPEPITRTPSPQSFQRLSTTTGIQKVVRCCEWSKSMQFKKISSSFIHFQS